MQGNAFISIILVCYNYAHLLPKALNAIASQTFRDFELVFVDNGCTDNSALVFERFCSEHPEIKVKLVTIEKNIGLSNGDNRGAQAASGKYLLFHDADDWMDENTLQLLSDAAKAADADRVVAAFRDIDDAGEVKQIQYLGDEPIGWLYGMQQANLFRASIYKENQIQTDSLWVDAEKTFKFSSSCKNWAFVFQPCYNYLVHFDSTSRKKELYKKFYSDEHYSFEHFLKACLPSVPAKENPMYVFAVYQLSRYYYSYLFQFTRDAPLHVKLKMYDELNATMKRYLPDYLDNVNKALKNKKATRPYARKIALLASFLERTHFMKLGLVGYHLASKVFFFQV